MPVLSRRPVLAVLACGVLALLAGEARAQKNLQWKFTKGDKLAYEMRQEMEQHMEVAGQKVDTKMSQSMDFEWRVGDVAADGSAEVSQHFTRAQLKMGLPTGEVEFDTKSDKEPEGVAKILAPMFQALIKEPVVMTMAPSGDIKNFKLPKGLADSLKKLPAAAQLGDMLSEDNLKQMTGATLAFPKGGVAKGKEWTVEKELKSPLGTMKIKMIYTYDGAETRDGREIDRIKQKLEMSIAGQGNMGITAKVKKQETDGVIYFDNAAGRMVEMSMKQDMTLSLSVAGQEIEQEMRQKTSIKPAGASSAEKK